MAEYASLPEYQYISIGKDMHPEYALNPASEICIWRIKCMYMVNLYALACSRMWKQRGAEKYPAPAGRGDGRQESCNKIQYRGESSRVGVEMNHAAGPR